MGDVWEGPGIPGLCDFEVVGRGGSSVVYRARQESLDRLVAVKLLLADLTDEKDVRRFRRECAVLGRLGRHRHIVDVFDAGVTRDHRPYIVMKLYEHGTVAETLREHGALPVEQAVQILTVVADALQDAHDHDVIHRDIKPENLLIDDDGQVVLTDFGVAAITDGSATMTTSSAYTESYVAPEVLDTNRYSRASDIYSLAATAYAMLTGIAPFGSTSGAQKLIAIGTKPPAPITTPGVPEELAQVVIAAMAKNPQDRVATPAQFAQQLQDSLTRPVSREPDRGPEDAAGEPRPDRVGEPVPPVAAAGGCRYCGALLHGSGAFCPACGRSQDPEAVSLAEVASESEEPLDLPDLADATQLRHSDEPAPAEVTQLKHSGEPDAAHPPQTRTPSDVIEPRPVGVVPTEPGRSTPSARPASDRQLPIRPGWQDGLAPIPHDEPKEPTPATGTPDTSRRRRGLVLAAVGGVVLVLTIAAALRGADYRYLFDGHTASETAADYLDKLTQRPLSTQCPGRLVRGSDTIKCTITDRSSGEAAGTITMGIRKDGTPYVRAVDISEARTATAPTPSSTPTPAVTVDPVADAKAEFVRLKRKHPRHTFSRVQPGWPWAVSISGKKARRWDYSEYRGWSRGELLLNMQDVRFERIQQRDVTGNRRRDFILHGRHSDGTPYGSLLVTIGNSGIGADDVRAATFIDDDGRYGAVFALQAVGATLISDYGSYGYTNEDGYERTKWVRKPGKKYLFVERPA